MLRSLVIFAAARTPVQLKRWVHRNHNRDIFTRKLFGKLLGTGVAVIPDGPMKGIRLVCGPQVSHAHLMGTYERETLEAVDRYVKPGDICYDLGASIGYLSILMARKAKHVYAFEPAPHAIEEIRKHTAANGLDNITIDTSPVTNGVREVSFAMSYAAFGAGINENATDREVIRLQTTTLDLFSSTHPLPDFMKIDIEGEEGRALEGAQQLLARKRPVICCEVHSEQAGHEVLAALSPHRYKVETLDGKPFQPTSDIVAGEVQVMCFPQ